MDLCSKCQNGNCSCPTSKDNSKLAPREDKEVKEKNLKRARAASVSDLNCDDVQEPATKRVRLDSGARDKESVIAQTPNFSEGSKDSREVGEESFLQATTSSAGVVRGIAIPRVTRNTINQYHLQQVASSSTATNGNNSQRVVRNGHGYPLDKCICGKCGLSEYQNRITGICCRRCGTTKYGNGVPIKRNEYKHHNEHPLCPACYQYDFENGHPRPICLMVRKKLGLIRRHETTQRKQEELQKQKSQERRFLEVPMNQTVDKAQHVANDEMSDEVVSEAVKVPMEQQAPINQAIGEIEEALDLEVVKTLLEKLVDKEVQTDEKVIENDLRADGRGMEANYEFLVQMLMSGQVEAKSLEDVRNDETDGQVKDELVEEPKEQQGNSMKQEPFLIPVLSMPILVMEPAGYIFCGNFYSLDHLFNLIGQIRTDLKEDLRLDGKKHQILEREFVWLPFWDDGYKRRLARFTKLTEDQVNEWHAERTRLERIGPHRSINFTERIQQARHFFQGIIPNYMADIIVNWVRMVM